MAKYKHKGGIFGGSPYPMVETDFQKNVSAVKDVMKSFDDMRKQRYDKELFSKIVSDLNKDDSKSEIEKIMGEIKSLDVDNVTGEPKKINQQKLMELVMNTQDKGGTPEATEMMKGRLSGEGQGGALSRIGNTLNPFGRYTGAPTELETMLLNRSGQQETPLEQLSKKAMIFKNLSNSLGTTEKPYQPMTREEQISFAREKSEATRKGETPESLANLYPTIDDALAEATKKKQETGIDFEPKWDGASNQYYLATTQPDIEDKIIRGMTAKDDKELINDFNYISADEVDPIKDKRTLNLYNKVAPKYGLPTYRLAKLDEQGNEVAKGIGTKWRYIPDTTQPTPAPTPTGLNETPATDTGISLPPEVTTTSQAVDYLIKNHGMTREQAIETIRNSQ